MLDERLIVFERTCYLGSIVTGLGMLKLFELPASTIDLGSARRLRDWMLFGARLLIWPLIVSTLVSAALQLGAWSKEFKIAGPFAAETNPPRASLVLNVPQEPPAPWWRQPLIG